MKQEALNKLAGASNAEELLRSIEALCRPFGSLKNIRLIQNTHCGEFWCFVEPGVQSVNRSIVEKLGGCYFGDGVAFKIPAKQLER